MTLEDFRATLSIRVLAWVLLSMMHSYGVAKLASLDVLIDLDLSGYIQTFERERDRSWPGTHASPRTLALGHRYTCHCRSAAL
ncbi:hypothetical protein ASPZODRAFT_263020 [Penicilliopsis zonata CBS 506.65]|uniref:Uncharacterized protein n=1 Tax=Penicilliopsis zonata CBS 506.65 TaxID=1073090 RepID=A0A1L9SUH6_9EURO|nr:hypothetical protein ASPZODRAFT_263020 [Penicilliopsis zonata CBS 506.65]OJJ50786.1 hypothetical protein ASPZODRAFT_263020 [Penicilliopsis zonata CBS 506.65]